MDVEEYRRRYEEELAREAERRNAMTDFSGGTESAVEGTATTETISGNDVGALIEIIFGEDEIVRRRIAALDAASVEIGESHELIEKTINLMRDESESAELRKAALGVLQQNSFRSALFAPKRPEYLAALSLVIEDRDEELRELALEILAKEKNEYAQRRLVEGLNDPSAALVPAEKAVQFLGYDVHGNYSALYREVIENPPNDAAKNEAVRLLSADPESRNLLADIFRNKGESPEIRKTGAIALQSIAPTQFELEAKQVVLDEEEDDDLRTVSLTALDQFTITESLAQDQIFTERVEELQQKPASDQFARAIDKYLTGRRR